LAGIARPTTRVNPPTSSYVGLWRSQSQRLRGINAERGLVEQGAPAIVRFITQVAGRFGVNVSEKVAAQAVSVIGAAGGMVNNVLFIDHFQEMARGHFIVRRLERTYDPQLVRAEYERL
jgi:hypothetical protein